MDRKTLIIGTCVIFLITLTFLACQRTSEDIADGEFGQADTEVQTTSDVEIRDVRPLDDPKNPYIGQYDSWDVWTYENRGGVVKGRFRTPDIGTGEYIMQTMVDDNGFMLPYMKYVRMQEDAAVSGDRSDIDVETHHWVWAVGEMEKSMITAAHNAAWDIKAEYFEIVPDWLIADPPCWSILLPNGHVVTVGDLGSAARDDGNDENGDGCCGGSPGSDLPYYLYNPSGTPIAATSTEDWFYLLFDQTTADRPDGVMSRRRDGYVFFEQNDGSINVYDYDGTVLDIHVEPVLRDIHPFAQLSPSQLERLKSAQERTGRI